MWLKYVWPVLAVVSLLGWVVLAASIGLWWAGQAWGWQEAKSAAMVAFLLFLLAVGFIVGRSAYGVVLDLARTRVAVGDERCGQHRRVQRLHQAAVARSVGAARGCQSPPSSICPA